MTDNVKTEITALSNVRSKYLGMIQAGLADPEETVAAFNSELAAAGLQNVIDEAQKQIDEWKAQ